jgi:hypothetical protein
MDIDFFKGFDLVDTVKLGKEIAEKVVSLDALNDMRMIELEFPEGHPDVGSSVEVYSLYNQKYAFAKGLSDLLSEECFKILNSPEAKGVESRESPSNPKVLSCLISLVLDSDVTYFAIG